MPFNPNPETSRETVTQIEKQLGQSLPEDYVRFMTTSNGGEGFFGDNYVILWKIEELPVLNAAYEVANNWPELLLFGTDGGGDAFGYDTKDKNWRIVRVPFIGMDRGSAMDLGRSFQEFMSNLESGRDGYGDRPEKRCQGDCT